MQSITNYPQQDVFVKKSPHFMCRVRIGGERMLISGSLGLVMPVVRQAVNSQRKGRAA